MSSHPPSGVSLRMEVFTVLTGLLADPSISDMFPWVRSFSLLERHSQSEGPPSATPAVVEDCNWYFLYHHHQLNVTLTLPFPERHCQLQTRETKLFISSRLGKVGSHFLKPEFSYPLERTTPEDQRVSVKSREVVVWRGLESLKSILHRKFAQDTPASRARERLKILESCEKEDK